jgi:flagellar motor switch protein FliG
VSDSAAGIDGLTGRQKAAILVVALGRASASEVMRRMTAREVETVALEIAELGDVPHALVEQVIAQFWDDASEDRRAERGGVDYAHEVLSDTFGAPDGERIFGKVVESIDSRSFRVLQQLDSGQLVSFLAGEHPQTIALVLVHLTPRRAALVMGGLPRQLQGDVAGRMARLGSVAPGAIKAIEAELEKHVSAIGLQSGSSGGPATVVEVLRELDRATEEGILESIADGDPDLADEIRDLMFVFEDVAQLDSRAIRELLKELETRELAIALKGASQGVAQKIFENVSQRARDAILEDMQYVGAVPLAEVETSQKAILGVLRRLEEEGKVRLTGREKTAGKGGAR